MSCLADSAVGTGGSSSTSVSDSDTEMRDGDVGSC